MVIKLAQHVAQSGNSKTCLSLMGLNFESGVFDCMQLDRQLT